MSRIKTKVLILIAVFAAAFSLGKLFSQSRTHRFTERSVAKLLDCDPAKVRKIELRGRETIVLERTDTASDQLFRSHVLDLLRWDLRTPENREADAARASKLASLACETFNPEPVSSAEKESVVFDGPSVRLVYGSNDQGNFDLKFSKKIIGRKAFVRVGENGPSFKVPENILQFFSVSVAELENRRVARITPGNVMMLETWRENKPLINLERNGDGWVLRQGKKVLGNGTAEADRYVNRAVNLYALKIYSGESPCGKRPEFRLDVSGVSGRKEEWKFIPSKNGFLVCNSQRDEVFLVHKDIAKYLNIPARRLM